MLSIRVSEQEWGAKVLDHISAEIQKEFKGLRGFSVPNMKKMRKFYEEYESLQTISTQFGYNIKEKGGITANNEIGSTMSSQINITSFLSLGFSHSRPAPELDNTIGQLG